MDNQRLRNLTTGRLHTKVDCIYEDLGEITGIQGLFTHDLPAAMNACLPWLRKHVTDERFWDDKYDPQHTGSYELPIPSDEDRKEMAKLFAEQPNLLAGKSTVSVLV